MDEEPVPQAVSREFVRVIHDIQVKTVASDYHPKRNEDAIFRIPEKNAFGVFDGMGGHTAGDLASQLARAYIEGEFLRLQNVPTIKQAQEVVRKLLLEANNVICRQQQIENNNMGTTASVVYVWVSPEGKMTAVIGNVGDSRVYLLRNGTLQQITLDDNIIRRVSQDKQQARELQKKMNNVVDPKRQLSKQEQFYFDIRNQIFQYLGMENIEPQIYTLDLLPTDRIIVCSDGISDNLTDKEIEKILKETPNNQKAVKKLIEAAQTRSRDKNHPRAKPDDMSVIIAGVMSPNVPQRVNPKPIRPAVNPPAQKEGPRRLTVNVRRSSGEIEKDWTVKRIIYERGVAVVEKIDGNNILVKTILLKDLNSLNPQLPIEISQASNFEQLFWYLSMIDGLQESTRFYSSNVLCIIINKVRAGTASIDAVTRAEGLRKKVAELLKRERGR